MAHKDPEIAKAYQREYAAKNAERKRAYREAHKEQIAGRMRQYYAEHAEERKAAAVAWRVKNPERWAAIQRRSAERNVEKIAAREQSEQRKEQKRLTNRARWAEDPEFRRTLDSERQTEYVKRHPQAGTAHTACVRARKDGRPADFRYLRTMPCPDVCPVLGTPISFAYGKGKRPAENTASFDQIVPGAGYIPGNVQIVSLLANQMKCNATPAQLHAFASWVQANIPE